MTDAEVIEKWNSEEFWSDFDEINARTGILIVDENMRNIDELEAVSYTHLAYFDFGTVNEIDIDFHSFTPFPYR